MKTDNQNDAKLYLPVEATQYIHSSMGTAVEISFNLS